MLIIPIAGAYQSLYDGDSLGIMGDDGFALSLTTKGQEINDTDQFGMTLLDAIYRGQDWRLSFRGKEMLDGMLNAFQPFGQVEFPLGDGGIFAPVLGVIGRRWTDMANILVLTAVVDTPANPDPVASLKAPISLTADFALIGPNTNVSQNFTSKVREIPIDMVLLPYSASLGDPAADYVVPFTTT